MSGLISLAIIVIFISIIAYIGENTRWGQAVTEELVGRMSR